MSANIRHFLLVYDRRKDELIEKCEFEDIDRATAAYEQVEARIRVGSDWIDAVLVGSDSLESVKITHSNYFTGNAKRRVRELLSL